MGDTKMKTKYLLTPLALALATVLSAGAYADGRNDDRDDRNDKRTTAGVELTDSQSNHGNYVNNEGTENTASVDGSLESAAGNVGVNVAAGDNNQQANAGAIAAADSAFIFANVEIDQTGRNNVLDNYSVPNNASLTNSANNASGNVGINIAAGNYNQQKNDMAIAYSGEATSASAVSNTSQRSHGNVTNNNATLEYESVGVTLSGGFSGGYSGQSDQIGDVYPDIWSGTASRGHPDVHPGGSAVGHFDLDTETQGGSDLNDDGGALAFNEAGTASLQGSVTGYLPITTGFSAPVVNNASVSNSLNGVSGNVGVNVAAGGGNQQSNSLTMAVGCQVCATTGGGSGGEL